MTSRTRHTMKDPQHTFCGIALPEVIKVPVQFVRYLDIDRFDGDNVGDCELCAEESGKNETLEAI